MRPRQWWVGCAFLGLTGVALVGQEADPIEALRQQIQEANRQFEQAVEAHRRTLEELNRRLEALRQQGSTHAPGTPSTPATAPADQVPPPSPPPVPAPVPSAWRPSDPIRLGGRGAAYMDVGLVGTFAVGSSTASDVEGGVESGGHDPYQRGFNVQGIELALLGAVDPYFRGNVNLVFSLDAAGESYFELEEAWMETVSLPANLQLRAGQVYTEFGRHNPTHMHTWSFVDNPLVNGRLLGPDGLRNPGARLSWLVPTPFYSELFLGVQDSHGATAASFRSGDGHTHGHGGAEALPLTYRYADNDRGLQHVTDLLFSPRYAVSVDLTSSQVLLAGASAAVGPNSRGAAGSGDTTTQIYGLDLTWKWKSPRHSGGFPFVTWQTEGLWRRYEVGAFDWDDNGNGVVDEDELEDLTTGLPARLPGETLTDYGFYSQWLYGFRRGWVAGLRLDYVAGQRGDYENLSLAIGGVAVGRDPQRAQHWRLSPNLSWYPSEFSKIRLQYNYDDRNAIGEDHSVWLQFEFLLGAHAAHKF